jgi:hypothetical protein
MIAALLSFLAVTDLRYFLVGSSAGFMYVS